MTTCDRCQRETRVTTMSFFNTDTLCMDCVKRERAHSSYEAAHEAECQAVRHGNYNFKGVGCPPELYRPKEENTP